MHLFAVNTHTGHSRHIHIQYWNQQRPIDLLVIENDQKPDVETRDAASVCGFATTIRMCIDNHRAMHTSKYVLWVCVCSWVKISQFFATQKIYLATRFCRRCVLLHFCNQSRFWRCASRRETGRIRLILNFMLGSIGGFQFSNFRKGIRLWFGM